MEQQNETNEPNTEEVKEEEKIIEHTISMRRIDSELILGVLGGVVIPPRHFSGYVSLQAKLLNGRDPDSLVGKQIPKPFELCQWAFTLPELRVLGVAAKQHDSFEFRGDVHQNLDLLAKKIEEMLKN